MRKIKVTFFLDNPNEPRVSQIVEANTYDEAIEKVQEMYNCELEIDELFDVFDSELLSKKIYIKMADGELYAVPVEPVVDKSIDATDFSQENWEDQFYHAKAEKLKYFETHESELIEIAKTIPWKNMKNKAMMIVRRRRATEENMAQSWIENEMEIN